MSWTHANDTCGKSVTWKIDSVLSSILCCLDVDCLQNFMELLSRNAVLVTAQFLFGTPWTNSAGKHCKFIFANNLPCAERSEICHSCLQTCNYSCACPGNLAWHVNTDKDQLNIKLIWNVIKHLKSTESPICATRLFPLASFSTPPLYKPFKSCLCFGPYSQRYLRQIVKIWEDERTTTH